MNLCIVCNLAYILTSYITTGIATFCVSAIEGLLLIAGSITQLEGIPVTEQSRMHASLLLNTVWEDLIGDKEMNKFKDRVGEFFR